MRADLHVHTRASDGALTPLELLSRASELGLMVGITDHETVDGAVEAKRSAPQRVVLGVEMAVRQAQELHLLVYFPSSPSSAWMDRFEEARKARRSRVVEMVERIAAHTGRRLDAAQVLGEGSMGRPHVAALLVKEGLARSVKEAFQRFLVPGAPGYVPRPLPTPQEVFDWARESSALSILAHPQEYGPLDLRAMKRAGLRGLEIYHPTSAPDGGSSLRAAAESEDLLVTGGSDFHDGRRSRLGAFGVEGEEFRRFAEALGDASLGTI